MKTIRHPLVVVACCLATLFGVVLLQLFSGADLAEAAKGGQPKVDICHYDADTVLYHQIAVAEPAVPAHISHGDAALGGACSAGVGECANDGVYVCSESGAACNAVPGEPAPEVCDALDNDCDASTDEDLGQTTCGLGVCKRTVNNCIAGEPQECTPGTAGSETCNNLDDDCDGTVDGMTGSCYSGPAGTAGVGACHAGSQACTAGNWGACSGQVLPALEQCNGIDDDCDGFVDEGLICE